MNIHAYIRICICIYTHTYTYMYVIHAAKMIEDQDVNEITDPAIDSQDPNKPVSMCVCMCVCMYVCIQRRSKYACEYVCMYVCMYVWWTANIQICL